MVNFYDRLQELSTSHLLALMPFDAIVFKHGFEGLCIPGLGILCYAEMGKGLMDFLPRLIPGSLLPQLNATLASICYESNNWYDNLWQVLELIVPGFDPVMISILAPGWATCRHIFDFAQDYPLYFWLQAKMHFHYYGRTHSGIFLCAIQQSNFADMFTTLQSQVNSYRKQYDDGYLPPHLCLHGLAKSIHQNAQAQLCNAVTPCLHHINFGSFLV